MIVRLAGPPSRARTGRHRTMVVLMIATLGLTWAGPASGEPGPSRAEVATPASASLQAAITTGSIAGVVTGPAGPVVGVGVSAVELSTHAYEFASTEADGTYVIAGLPAGTYRVTFVPPASSGLRREFYDDAVHGTWAVALVLTEGQDLTGIDAVLARESDPVFRDVAAGAPFRAEIEQLALWGLASGWPDGTFRPSAPVERQAMAAFLYRYAQAAGFTPPSTPTFPDVPVSSPFYTEIEWLAAHGLATGWPDGTFRPTATIERQAMAAFLYRFAGEPEFAASATASFTDVPTEVAFFDEVEWLGSLGVTTGWPDGTFRPAAPVERQAMAAFLVRFDESWVRR